MPFPDNLDSKSPASPVVTSASTATAGPSTGSSAGSPAVSAFRYNGSATSVITRKFDDKDFLDPILKEFNAIFRELKLTKDKDRKVELNEKLIALLNKIPKKNRAFAFYQKLAGQQHMVGCYFIDQLPILEENMISLNEDGALKLSKLTLDEYNELKSSGFTLQKYNLWKEGMRRFKAGLRALNKIPVENYTTNTWLTAIKIRFDMAKAYRATKEFKKANREYEKGIREYEKAISFFKKMPKPENEFGFYISWFDFLSGVAMVYYNEKNYLKAIDAYSVVINKFHEISKPARVFDSYKLWVHYLLANAWIGKSYGSMGQGKKMLLQFEATLEIAKNVPSQVIHSYSQIMQDIQLRLDEEFLKTSDPAILRLIARCQFKFLTYFPDYEPQKNTEKILKVIRAIRKIPAAELLPEDIQIFDNFKQLGQKRLTLYEDAAISTSYWRVRSFLAENRAAMVPQQIPAPVVGVAAPQQAPAKTKLQNP